MILSIKCATQGCEQETVRYVDGEYGKYQLQCMACGSTEFHACHVREPNCSVTRIKEGLARLKATDYTDFDTIIESVTEDFDELMKHL